MKVISKLLEISFIKTLCFNLHYFGFSGLKFPVIISRRTKIEKMGGKVNIVNAKPLSIRIGFGPLQASKMIARWYNTGIVNFVTKAHLYRGCYIYNNGNINIGYDAILGASRFFCEKEITIGDNTMISWDCSIMDSDLHIIYDSGKNNILNHNRKIYIGKHVWVGYGCDILKGSSIPDDSIIAAKSLITNRELNEQNCIYGTKGEIIKRNILWVWEKENEE